MPATLAQLRSVLISTRGYGQFRLRRLAVADIEFLEALSLEDPVAPEYVIRLLHHQLMTPQLTTEELSGLPPAVLVHVARVWLRRNAIAVGEENAATGVADGMKQAVAGYLADWRSRQREQKDPLTESLRQSVQQNLNLIPQDMANMVASYQQSVRSFLSSIQQPLLNMRHLNRFFTDIARSTQIGPGAQALITWRTAVFPGMFQHSFPTASIFRALQSDFNTSVASIQRSIQQIFSDGAYRTAIQWLAAENRWARWLADVEAAEAIFADTGYGFADFLPLSFVMESSRRDPRTRHAIVTLQLAAYLHSEQFAEEMYTLFASSRLLRRRWNSVSGGLQAHQQRDYQKSVLTWMREVEGIFKDLLVVMGSARRTGETYVALRNGVIVYRRNGQPHILDGIAPAVNHAHFDTTARLYPAAETLNNDFRLDRNPISHGSRYDYQEAKLSVKGLLLIRMMAEEIVKLETPH